MVLNQISDPIRFKYLIRSDLEGCNNKNRNKITNGRIENRLEMK